MLIRNLSISLSIALLGVSFGPNFWVLILATFLIGASANITQQILPFAALLSTPEKQGEGHLDPDDWTDCRPPAITNT